MDTQSCPKPPLMGLLANVILFSRFMGNDELWKRNSSDFARGPTQSIRSRERYGQYEVADSRFTTSSKFAFQWEHDGYYELLILQHRRGENEPTTMSKPMVVTASLEMHGCVLLLRMSITQRCKAVGEEERFNATAPQLPTIPQGKHMAMQTRPASLQGSWPLPPREHSHSHSQSTTCPSASL